jgi:dTDP-4-amino-4,6-dideoxygalactose transaminase
MGEEIQAFENSFKKYTGLKHAIGVSSGTAGLHLCIRAADVKDQDLVITTPFSFVSSTNVILFERAIPILIDVDPLTGNIDPEKVREAVEDLIEGGDKTQKWMPCKGVNHINRLKAILPVDVFGQPADMDPIRDVAKSHKLTVIEDSCEALGSEYKNQKAGTLGDCAVFAFYPNKQITTGEGGVIVTDDDQSADIMRALRNQGRSPGDTWLQHTQLGYNYRLNEMSSALGCIQMERLEELLAKREQVAHWYNERISEIQAIEKPYISSNTTQMSWFVYVVRFTPEFNRDHIADVLSRHGIPARPYFIPIHLQPYMVKRFGYREGDFPITEDLGKRGLALPFSGVMDEEQVDQVCQILEKIVDQEEALM